MKMGGGRNLLNIFVLLYPYVGLCFFTSWYMLNLLFHQASVLMNRVVGSGR
jgi:hypothetical protein